MRVLLVDPPLEYPSRYNAVAVNTGLLSIAAYAHRFLGSAVRFKYYPMNLYDFVGLKHDLSAKLLGFSPDVICLGAITASYPSCCEIAHKVKQILPKALVVLGGVYASVAKRTVFDDDTAIDLVVVGEGEKPFLDLLRSLLHGKRIPPTTGLLQRGAQHAVPAQFADPIYLDDLPIPMFEISPIQLYKSIGVSFPYETSRGCRGSCAFCYLRDFVKPYREKSPEAIANQLETLRSVHGIQKVFLSDDTFGLNRDHGLQVLRALRNSEMKSILTTRLDVIDKEILDNMAESGVEGVIYGVESVDSRILVDMRKVANTNAAIDWGSRMKRLTEHGNANGITMHPVFMLGWPGETQASLDINLRMAESVIHLPNVSPFVSFVTPHPQSSLWRKRDKLGLKVITSDLRKFIHILPVAYPTSLGEAEDALRAMLNVHNRMRVYSGTEYRNPTIGLEQVLEYADLLGY